MATHRGSSRKHATPTDLDNLFARHVIDEEDYRDFWESYWKGNAKERRDLVNEYIEIASESGNEEVVGVVTRNRLDAERQAQALNDLGTVAYKVVRRNAKGRLSKRGTFYQAIRRG